MLDITKTHVLAVSILWFSLLTGFFVLDYTVLASEDDNITLIGDIQNVKSLGNGRSDIVLINATNPLIGQDYGNQTIEITNIEIIARNGQTFTLHEVEDPVVFPVIHEPVLSKWSDYYLDGKKVFSGKPANNLFLVPGVISVFSLISIVSIVILQRKNGDEPNNRSSTK